MKKKEMEKRLIELERLYERERVAFQAYRDGLSQLRMDVSIPPRNWAAWGLAAKMLVAAAILIAGLLYATKVAFKGDSLALASPARGVAPSVHVQQDRPKVIHQDDLVTLAARKGDLITRARR